MFGGINNLVYLCNNIMYTMVTVTSACSKRLKWIDWMKAMGIYLIVLGHFFSVGCKFVYVFHVPLFFTISGFLSKREVDRQVFWKKLWYNLVVPMLMMAVAIFIYNSIVQLFEGTLEWQTFYLFARNVLFGMVLGFDNLWFVYTLILLKIIFQYCILKKLFYSLTIVMLALAYSYNTLDFAGFPFFLNEPNSIINVCTAFPFFAFGLFVRDYKVLLNEWNNMIMLMFAFLCGFLFDLICMFYNGGVEMYCCNYGRNMMLFLLGGIAGCVMIFAASKLLGNASKIVVIISRGTIIILGFHKLFIDLIRLFFPASYLDIGFAAFVVVFFIPLILATEKYLPLMAGKYRSPKYDDDKYNTY